ncbi:hypothetical protein Tco_1234692 [Tanacetum coccineum]
MASNPKNVRLNVIMKLQEALDEEAILEEQMLALMHHFADRFTDRRIEINNLMVLQDRPLIDYGKNGYIKNHKKTVKNGQARTRESEEYKKKPKNQSRSQKSQTRINRKMLDVSIASLHSGHASHVMEINTPCIEIVPYRESMVGQPP